MRKLIRIDGYSMFVGSPLWKWFTRNRSRIEGNPAPINPSHPKAPKSHPLAKPSLSFARQIVAFANEGLSYAGRMVYSEGGDRSELFHRMGGEFAGAHADCSQYVASILHWVGVKIVTDTDYTGTLLEKGKLLKQPKIGCVAIWGPGTGAHAAFVTEKTPGGRDWYVVGFGHQGAPDRSTLSGMNAYFEQVGQPGVRYLDFTG